MFFNGSHVKTQIGWHSETLKMLFGDEVDDAIRRGKLLRGSHIRGLKLALLDPSGPTQAERTRLQKQMKALRRKFRLGKAKSEAGQQLSKLTLEDLVSEFIGYLARHCLYEVCKAWSQAGLPRPMLDPQRTFRDLDPYDYRQSRRLRCGTKSVYGRICGLDCRCDSESRVLQGCCCTRAGLRTAVATADRV